MDVGDVRARLGARFEDDGFDRFDRAIEKAKRHANELAPVALKGDYDPRGFDRYERSLRDVDEAHRGFVRGSGRVRTALGSLFIGGAGVAAAASAFYALKQGVTATFGAFKESERVARQTRAVLESTGGAANLTSKQITGLAGSLSMKAGVDDEAIQSGENLLLTFTKVRDEAGKGNDIFTQATRVMLDMSVALGQDMKSSAIQLGKALNDPVRGVTALQRVGVSFTASQREQIKTLAESGRMLDAQKIILRELTTEFGGSAAATATNTSRLKVALGNLQEAIGRQLSPVIERAAAKLTPFITGMVDGTGAGGRFAEKAREVAQAVWEVARRVGGVVVAFARFIGQHPALVKVAGTLAAVAVTLRGLQRLRRWSGIEALLGLLDRVGPSAARSGTIAGGAFGGGLASRAARVLRGFGWSAVGLAIADALGLDRPAKRFVSNLTDWVTGGSRALRDAGREALAEAKRFDVLRDTIGRVGDVWREFDRRLTASKTNTRSALRQIREQVAGGAAFIRQRLGSETERGANALAANFRRAAQAVRTQMRNGTVSTQAGLSEIRRLLVAALGELGLTPAAARSYLDNARSGGRSGFHAGDPGGAAAGGSAPVIAGRATGLFRRLATGWVGQRGETGRDTVPALLGRGEAVLNRHQQAVIEGLLGTGFLDRLFARVRTPHYLAAGGRIPRVLSTLRGLLGADAQRTLDVDRAGAQHLLDVAVPPAVPSAGIAKGLVEQVRRAIAWAQAHGWHGSFTGLRSYAEQVRLYNLLGPKYAAKPGTSNHGTGQAIDVTDPEGFARAMASAPPGARLVRGMAWEPWHFSITGFAKGGRAGRRAGRLVAGARSLVSRVGGLDGFATAISGMERQYGQLDRLYGLSDEQFIVEDEQGAHIDQKAVEQRGQELGGLYGLRQRIRGQAQAYERALTGAIRTYRAAIERVTRALRAVSASKSPKIRKRRDGYRSLLDTYKGRLSELIDSRRGVKGDIEDYRIDLLELAGEMQAISPEALAKQLPASPVGDVGAGLDATPSGDADTPTGEVSGRPDTDAMLAQARERISILEETARIANATLAAFGSPGDIGTSGYQNAYVAVRDQATPVSMEPAGTGGQSDPGAAGQGVTIVVNTLHPGDPRVLRAIGDAATAGISLQPARSSPRERLGV